MSSVRLESGARQTLAFHLSGDLVSTGDIFHPQQGRIIETITNIVYRRFPRDALRAAILKHEDGVAELFKQYLEEKVCADQLALDLGRRTADERIARLILSLMDRLARRDLVQENMMQFPLRHHHIADATGLTPVHVSNVLRSFRRENLIHVDRRTLKILDIKSLHRIAKMR